MGPAANPKLLYYCKLTAIVQLPNAKPQLCHYCNFFSNCYNPFSRYLCSESGWQVTLPLLLVALCIWQVIGRRLCFDSFWGWLLSRSISYLCLQQLIIDSYSNSFVGSLAFGYPSTNGWLLSCFTTNHHLLFGGVSLLWQMLSTMFGWPSVSGRQSMVNSWWLTADDRESWWGWSMWSPHCHDWS